MKPLISVILPIYNVQKYLPQCLKTVLSQTYRELEIILVDDGSTDSSGLVCDKYSELDDRITTYHKVNGGLSDARNYGFERSSGELVIFIDSDDCINENMIDELYKAMQKSNAQIAVCNYRKFVDSDTVPFNEEETIRELVEINDKNKLIQYSITENLDVFTVAWNKLFRRTLFEDIRYPVGKIHEDVYTTYLLLYKAKEIVYLDADYYYYRQRPDSIMGTPSLSKQLSRLEGFKQQIQFYVTRNEFDFLWEIMFYYKLFLQKAYVDSNHKKEEETAVAGYLKFYQKTVFKYLRKSSSTSKRKVAYFVYAAVPMLFLLRR